MWEFGLFNMIMKDQLRIMGEKREMKLITSNVLANWQVTETEKHCNKY